MDLEKTKRLTGIITQGAKDFGVMQFVSMFKVAYSDDGLSWSTVKEENGFKDKVRQISKDSQRSSLSRPYSLRSLGRSKSGGIILNVARRIVFNQSGPAILMTCTEFEVLYFQTL